MTDKLGQSPFLRRVMTDCGTVLSPGAFLKEVNVVFHDTGVSDYDTDHALMWRDEEQVWRRLCGVVSRTLSKGSGLSIMDFGAGTGIAAHQLCQYFGPTRVARVVLVEPSLGMRRRATERFKAIPVAVEAMSELPAHGGAAEFDIVCANSVLHHLADPLGVVRMLGEAAATGGVLVVAQEPNRLFQRGLVRFLNSSARSLLGNLRREPKPGVPMVHQIRTANELQRRGVTKSPIRPEDVGLLVDFWVPRPWHPERCREALGFTTDDLLRALPKGFGVRLSFTYQHLGKRRGELRPLLRQIDLLLALVFPMRGQEIAAVFAR